MATRERLGDDPLQDALERTNSANAVERRLVALTNTDSVTIEGGGTRLGILDLMNYDRLDCGDE